MNDHFSPSNMTRREHHYFDAVRNNLRREMIHPRYRDKPENKYYGHCLHASVALYILLGGKEAGYQLWRGVDDNGDHSWLRSPGGYIIDPTAEQYYNFGKQPPYNSNTKRIGYRMSKVMQQLVDAALKSLEKKPNADKP